MKMRFLALFGLLCLALGIGSGCAVPQPRGQGLYRRIEEPRTGGVYHLYLPMDYVRNNGRHPHYPKVNLWPLVMTFHGMKPYDNAIPQEREWEKEADTYGYIVCAPELQTSSSLMEYPLTKEHSYVLKDRERVLAIMDHVFLTTRADPENVLSTSWSCGGYLAHYFPNRFPERFKCIATRLSNFSAKLLIEETVPRYRDRLSAGIFIGDGDLPKCKSESEEAVAWYTARNFKVVRGKMIDRMGHRRIPQTAAAFFAEQIGIRPLHPHEAARTVAQVQMTEYHPPQALIAAMSPKLTQAPALAAATPRKIKKPKAQPPRRSASVRKPPVAYVSMNAGRSYPFEQGPVYDPYPQGSRRASDSKKKPRVTGDEKTRLASARPRKGNWLAPVQETDGSKPAAAADSKTRKRQAKPRDGGPAVTRRGTLADARKVTTRFPERDFTPQDVGSRNHDLWLAKGPTRRVAENIRPNSKNPAQQRATSSKKIDAPRNRLAAPRSNALTRQRSLARRVKIKIKGPAVGTIPHYLSYGVALADSVIDGADFLWKDNGVWMGDEPTGIKILDSPGLHRISVLLVTRDNTEYRGAATVQVLEQAPSLSSAAGGAR